MLNQMSDANVITSASTSPPAAPDTTGDNKYVILMETNGDECESWYYFIKYQGNEDALKFLEKQLDQVEMFIVDEYSTFDLDLENLVSETTAKEMTLVELNSVTFHRKFDGTMQLINIGLKKKDSNEKRIKRVHDKLGMGKVEDYVDGEDVEDADELSGSEESEHEEDADLVPLPVSVAKGQALLAQSQPGLSAIERAAVKKRKGKKH